MKVIRKHLVSIHSTNNWVKQNIGSLPKDSLFLLTAEEQTGGRGRFNRKWESPSGQNIYATFAFFIHRSRSDVGNIPQVLALSVIKTLVNQGFTPKIKWPNDILLSNKKIGGILGETSEVSAQLCVIIGIGLNINMSIESLNQIGRPATSLFAESGKLYSVEEQIQSLQDQFEKDLTIFLEEGFGAFVSDYRSYMWVDRVNSVRFHDNQHTWEGIILNIDEKGCLYLQLESGEIKKFAAGEFL